jgi:hypothetical protein
MYKANNKPGYDYLRCPSVKTGLHKGMSVNLERFETSFINLIIDHKDFIASMAGNEKPNRISEFEFSISENRKKLIQVTNDYSETPSKSLATILQTLEATVEKLTTSLEKEKALVAVSTPLKDGLSNTVNSFLILNKTNRIKARESIRSIIDHIKIEGVEQKYEVFFKNISEPATVYLHKNGFTFNGNRYQTFGINDPIPEGLSNPLIQIRNWFKRIPSIKT